MTSASVPPSRERGIDARELSRLKWRCRRGLLENDLLIERFFQVHEATLTEHQACGLRVLMDLADNDLLDLLMRRTQPTGALDTDEVREVLGLLRPSGPASIPDTSDPSPNEKAGPGCEEQR